MTPTARSWFSSLSEGNPVGGYVPKIVQHTDVRDGSGAGALAAIQAVSVCLCMIAVIRECRIVGKCVIAGDCVIKAGEC